MVWELYFSSVLNKHLQIILYWQR